MIKIFATLLISGIAFSQVGINTETPEAMLDINGNIIIRDIPNGQLTDSILVTNNGRVKKIALSDLNLTQSVCPNIVTRDQYNLYFVSNSSVPNPNSSILIQVGSATHSFGQSGSWTENNQYHFRYSNGSGQNVNLNNGFKVNFNGLNCQY